MASNFPTNLDSYSDIVCGDSQNPKDVVNNLQDAVEAIEAKVGKDSSAVTTSHDYKLSEVTGTDKAVGKTATQTLTNKTLTNPTITSGVINGGNVLTADSSELNVLDGITASTTELNYTDTTAGTVEASKAVIVDANKDANFGTGDISATDITSSGILTLAAMAGTWDGWIAAGETWTYASADSPIFTFTISGDKSTKYYAGMRIKLTQSTGGTKYFIIHRVSYSNPNTTITAYGGTDYILNNEAISSPFYSMKRVPAGFDASSTKWTINYSNSSNNFQISPTAGVVYNPGSASFSLHVGSWITTLQCSLFGSRASAAATALLGALSTANNSNTTAGITVTGIVPQVRAWVESVTRIEMNNATQCILSTTSKTTIYVVAVALVSSMAVVGFNGADFPTRVEMVSAYL